MEVRLERRVWTHLFIRKGLIRVGGQPFWLVSLMIIGSGLHKDIPVIPDYCWVNDGKKYRVFPASFRVDDAFGRSLQV